MSVRVYARNHVVVVAVRMLVVELVKKRAVRVVRVIHTGAEIRVCEILVLMIEPERMPDLLTHDKVLPSGRAVLRQSEIGIVQFHNGLRDVAVLASIHPYLCDAEPAVLTIRAIANFHPAERWVAVGVTRACNSHIFEQRCVPVGRSASQTFLPRSGRQIIAERERICERIGSRKIPMILSPCVVGLRYAVRSDNDEKRERRKEHLCACAMCNAYHVVIVYSQFKRVQSRMGRHSRDQT